MIKPLIAITRKHAVLFAIFFVLYEFLVYTANDMIMPGMLAVVQEFHSNEYRIASSLTAYILGGASLQLLLGPISDSYGRRPVMLFGAALFSICYLILPLSHHIDQFLIIRFFEGMGLCYINVVGYALLQEIFSDKDAIKMIAIMANIAILAPLMGPLAGSIFLQYANWRAIFYLIGGFSLLAFWGLWQYMPESVGQIKQDGTMIQPREFSMSSMVVNYKILAQHPPFILGTLAYALIGVPCVVWIGLSPVILVNKAHMSMVTYGLWQLPVFGAFILANILLTLLAIRFSIKHLTLVGSIIVLVGLGLMYLLSNCYGGEPFGLLPGLVIYSLGYGLAVTPLNRFILFLTQIGTGSTAALISTISMCCLAAGSALGNTLFLVDGNLGIANYAAWVGIIYFACAFGCILPFKSEKI